jgi:serine/threonine protein kinase
MRPMLNSCDGERLRLLAQDLLTPAETTWLEEHVEHCALCRETLDRLVEDDRWLSAVRHDLGSDETSAHDTGPAAGDSLDFLATSDWPDSMGRLGTYEVIGVLGRGGMGVVLKAFDPALSRNIAIKVLSAALASCGAARRRFLREARAAAAVVHEHVVSVFAVEETAGLPFLVMEYVPGRSLQDRLDKSGPLSLPEILRIGMQTASGLAAAHAQGLVHRDVKPANILLENGVERVRLSDFGLARAAADAAVTQSGLIAGTPHYMAPEQARGETSDHRSDLFSLGSTLYAICAGHPPFRAESPLAVLRRVCDHDPRPLREINPDIPAWLESIIAKLHAKDPSQRYPSASHVADLLGRCLAHVQQPLAVSLPAEAIPRAKPTDARRPYRRRWAGALLGMAAVGGGAFALGPWRARKSRHAVQEIVKADPSLRGSSPLARQSLGATDELTQQIELTRGRARALEADLHQPVDLIVRDRVSALALDLANQTRALEREIATNSDGYRGRLDRPPSSNLIKGDVP